MNQACGPWMVPCKELAYLTPLFRVKRGLFGLQFGDQLGNAVERLLIQHSTRNNLEVPNLDVDLVALTAHELAPHSRELMFMNDLRACGYFVACNPEASGRGQTRIGKLATRAVFQVSKVVSQSEHSKLAIWRTGAMAPVCGCVDRAALAGSVTGF